MLPQDYYKDLIKLVPVLCVDVIITNPDGQYLLVKRKNDPKKGHWWVIGGRLNHFEEAVDAAKRKALEEASVQLNDLSFVGFYQGFFGKSAFGNHKYHTVSLVFKSIVPKNCQISLDTQSSNWKWSDILPHDFIIENRI